MRKFLFVYALLSTAAAALGLWWGSACFDEARRQSGNVRTLTDSLHRYRTRLDEEAASVAALQLRCDEFRELRAADARRIRELGIRLRRVESSATTVTASQTRITAVVHDTVIVRDTLRAFGWSDGWTTVEGRLGDSTLDCRIESIDTLRQVVHRVPRRFLFVRFGTKGIRQEIVSSNPHTRIVFAEYIEFEGRRRRRKG